MTAGLVPDASRSAVAARPREGDLLAAATRLFRERGFHATSMQDLGEALGMNRGSLYHYIASKDDLLWTIMDRALDRLETRVRPELEADGSPVQRLKRAVHAHLAVAADHADELSLLQIELRSLGPARRAHMLARRDGYEMRWRDVIAEGVATGELRDVDVRLAGIVILSACNWFTQWYRRGGDLTVEQIGDAFVGLFVGGLSPSEGEA